MQFIENKTFDEINLGDSASAGHVLSSEDISLFRLVFGDASPMQINSGYLHNGSGHSLWINALVSKLLDTQLPGAGTVYFGQTLQFVKPITVGDTITATVTVKQKKSDQRQVVLDCRCVNQENQVVSLGTVEVIAPTEKVRTQLTLSSFLTSANPCTQLQRLVDMTEEYPPIRMAVVHPVDSNSLMGAIDAAKRNLIEPILVGPTQKIQAAADKEGIDISAYELIDTEHSHGAAEKAVAMARAGEVEAIMKGSLHTDELMSAAVQRGTGIATARRMSHVWLMDVPTYPRPLLVTDGAINIDPSLEEKCDIVQNAIELAHALKIPMPRVALLSAVETVSPKLRSTLEAAAICKMAHRKQIVGALIDGPLAFDNAVSEKAAHIKGIESEVAGRADILVAPDLEAGNMVAKQLEYMAGAESSGIVLGARVPIALTSRADTVMSRMASCALAVLLVRNKKKMIP